MLEGEDVSDGEVVWAHEQFQGRGQHDHAWISAPGLNLTFSIILRPSFLPPVRQFQLNKVIALGIVDFLKNALQDTLQGHEVVIKWPNDIYFGGRKMGGVLIESRIMGSQIDSMVAGIGLNMNQTGFDSSLPNPVSLAMVLSHQCNIRDELPRLLWFIDQRYAQLIAAADALIDHDFNKSLLGFGVARWFHFDGGVLEGTIRGVDENGRLLVETASGECMVFNHKEIEYIL